MATYRYGEGFTEQGQLVQFTADSDNFEAAKLAVEQFRTITTPLSHVVNVEHGGYGRYSRYDINQIKYAGGQNEAGGGYYEILEIADAPNDRHGIVSHGYNHSNGASEEFFVEWETSEDAVRHMKSSRIASADDFLNVEEPIPGVIRVVPTGQLAPWFYATGNATLVGDYVFPEHLSNDPVFKFGRQFLVPNKLNNSDDIMHIPKTCMGATEEERRNPSNSYYGHDYKEKIKVKVVQWDDGSVTRLAPDTPDNLYPVPSAETDAWVTDAKRKFLEMLSGYHLGFEIEFIDGGKFVGKYVPPPEAPKPTPAGSYYAVVTFEDGEVIDGWVKDFSPTEDMPTITSRIVKGFPSRTIKSIEIPRKRAKSGGKKWLGAFYKSLETPNADSPNA